MGSEHDGVDCFNEVYHCFPGYQGPGAAVCHCQTGVAVIAVKDQFCLGIGFAVQMQGQADLLLLDVPAEELHDVDTAQALEELKAEEQV